MLWSATKAVLTLQPLGQRYEPLERLGLAPLSSERLGAADLTLERLTPAGCRQRALLFSVIFGAVVDGCAESLFVSRRRRRRRYLFLADRVHRR